MPESIYSKIYSYRQRENKDSKENYIIEIFAHCLQTDNKLLKDFLSYFDITSLDIINIKTQSIYEFGRPDIEINIPSQKICILIECKIEHFERPNQLNDYKKILELKPNTKRHLVYLTKYYDGRQNSNKNLKLHLLKWFDIFQIINEENTNLTQELKSFIKDEGMSESKNFNYTDLTVLKNFTGTIRKMDEVLDGIKQYYELKIGILSKDSARSTRLKDEWYSSYQIITKQNKYWIRISIGFIWWDDEIWVGTRVDMSLSEKYKNVDNYKKLFKQVLRGWKVVEDMDNHFSIENCKQVAQFIIDEEEQIPEMVKHLKEGIDKLAILKKLDKSLFS